MTKASQIIRETAVMHCIGNMEILKVAHLNQKIFFGLKQ
jgi:hypothetical protein